ncbi:MAG: type IV secretion system protein [Gemmatimonadaceae bacterium]|nr:type IV secretion system protein [Gemmatimonadaceae bacterium]
MFSDLAKGKRNWQLVAFGTTAVALVLAATLTTLATEARITPYVVEVDRLGRAPSLGPAERLAKIDQRVITSQLAGSVRDVRTVLADPIAQGALVERAYAFVDRNAAAWLNDYFADPTNDPRLLGKTLTRLVEVTSVLPVLGSHTWKVTWTERALPRGATGTASESAWEGYFATRVVPPTTTERITINPLGRYVTAINWTQLAQRQRDATSTASAGGIAP